MATKFHALLLIIFLSFLISSTLFCKSAASTDKDLSPTDNFHALDPNDPEVVAVGKFAVQENNKQKKENIKFENVLKVAGQQVGEKTEYGLLIKAAKNGVSSTYLAVVLDTKNSGKELVGFRKQAVTI